MDEKLKKAAGELSEKTGKAALLAKEKLSEQLDNEQMKKAARAVADKSKEALEKAKNLNAEDIKNVKEIGSKAKQELEKCSKKKNPMWIVVVLGVLAVVGIFSRMGDSGDSGYEKILGMDKSAVDKKYGAPVECTVKGADAAYMHSNKFYVVYDENGKAEYIGLGTVGEVFGIKLGDDSKTVDKALEKYNFEYVSMDDDGLYYGNSEYWLLITPNEAGYPSEISVARRKK